MSTTYTVYGPDRPFVSKAKVAEFFQIGTDVIDRLVSTGEFPRPLADLPSDEPTWLYSDVIYFGLYAAVKDRLKADPAPGRPST